MITDANVQNIAHRLNNRPRRLLGYMTPTEALRQTAGIRALHFEFESGWDSSDIVPKKSLKNLLT